MPVCSDDSIDEQSASESSYDEDEDHDDDDDFSIAELPISGEKHF